MRNYISIEGTEVELSDETVKNIKKMLPKKTFKLGQRFRGCTSRTIFQLYKDGAYSSEATLLNITKCYVCSQKFKLNDDDTIDAELFDRLYGEGQIVPIED